MAYLYADINKLINLSLDIASLSKRMGDMKASIDGVKVTNVLGSSEAAVDKTIRQAGDAVIDEAAKMNSLSDALRTIALKYRAAENTAAGNVSTVELPSQSTVTVPGGGKWLTVGGPDPYYTTTKEQEQAADAAMKLEMWALLQDDRYSEQTWTSSSIAERKQILQEYMDEVIKIFGLQSVNSTLAWSGSLTYTAGLITWGTYADSIHTVTLNSQSLLETVGNWDSYHLLQSVGHLLRYAYQHEAINHPEQFLVTQETLDIWRYGLENYISPTPDFDAYYRQTVEVDARSFGVSKYDKM